MRPIGYDTLAWSRYRVRAARREHPGDRDLWFFLEGLLLEPAVAQAGKPVARRPVKRGKVWRGKRPVARRGAIAALPPLRDAGGDGTSVMPTTGDGLVRGVPGSGRGGLAQGKSAPPPPPALAPKGPAALVGRKKKDHPATRT